MVKDRTLSPACRNFFQTSDESVLSDQLTRKWILLIRRREEDKIPAEDGARR